MKKSSNEPESSFHFGSALGICFWHLVDIVLKLRTGVSADFAKCFLKVYIMNFVIEI